MRVERQLSLILENRPGVLAEVCADLARAKVNLLAISVANLVDHSVVRMVVSDPGRAIHLLGAGGVLVFENEVVAVTAVNRPGTLSEVARRLGKAKVNIDYLYASAPGRGKVTIYLRVSSIKKARATLARFR